MRKFAVPFQELDFEGKLEKKEWMILAHSKEDARNKTMEFFSENEHIKHIASTSYISDLGKYNRETDWCKGYHNPY